MANTVWKGQLTFGLVSFPVRLVRAARKERVPLRLIRKVSPAESDEEDETGSVVESRASGGAESEPAGGDYSKMPLQTPVASVHQRYVADEEDSPIGLGQLQRGYEVAPGRFAVVHTEELRRLRQPTSAAMEIVRSVHMDEIDPVFLESSYYVLPGNGGEHPYGLFYRALKESGYAALADVAMHGRQHVIVLRPGEKGLIAHTMYYVNEVRDSEEHLAEAADVAPKELALAKRFVEAIAAPFQPEEFSDLYREQLQALIDSKETASTRTTQNVAPTANTKVIDIMDALKKSLEKVKTKKTSRKPMSAASATKARKRHA